MLPSGSLMDGCRAEWSGRRTVVRRAGEWLEVFGEPQKSTQDDDEDLSRDEYLQQKRRIVSKQEATLLELKNASPDAVPATKSARGMLQLSDALALSDALSPAPVTTARGDMQRILLAGRRARELRKVTGVEHAESYRLNGWMDRCTRSWSALGSL